MTEPGSRPLPDRVFSVSRPLPFGVWPAPPGTTINSWKIWALGGVAGLFAKSWGEGAQLLVRQTAAPATGRAAGKRRYSTKTLANAWFGEVARIARVGFGGGIARVQENIFARDCCFRQWSSVFSTSLIQSEMPVITGQDGGIGIWLEVSCTRTRLHPEGVLELAAVL